MPPLDPLVFHGSDSTARTTMSVAAVTSFIGIRESSHVLYLVVLADLDALRAQQIVQSVAWVTLVANPVLHACEHVPVELKVVVSDRRVVKNAAHVVHDFILRYVGVVPGVDDARCDVL
jgi:hypothetical protein